MQLMTLNKMLVICLSFLFFETVCGEKIFGFGSTPCTHHSGTSFFDLTPLKKVGKDVWTKDGANYEKYFLNICNNTSKDSVPEECKDMAKTNPSPGYSVQNGKCSWLAKLNTQQWTVIDKKDFHKGIELTYEDGPPCDSGNKHRIRYHFICSPNGEKTAPPISIIEQPHTCESEVIWQTPFACPVIKESSHIFTYVFTRMIMLLIVFIAFRFMVSYVIFKKRGVYACPDFVQTSLTALNTSAYINTSINKLKGLRNQTEYSYEGISKGRSGSSCSSAGELQNGNSILSEDDIEKASIVNDFNSRFPMNQESSYDKQVDDVASGLKNALDLGEDIESHNTKAVRERSKINESDSSYDACDGIDNPFNDDLHDDEEEDYNEFDNDGPQDALLEMAGESDEDFRLMN